MKLCFIMKSDALICIWILLIPNDIYEVSTPRDWSFWIHIISLHDYWPRITWNSLQHKTWGEKGEMWITCLSVPQNVKKGNQLKHKNQVCSRNYIDSYVFENGGLYFSLGAKHKKTNVYINFNKNNKNLEIFCLDLTVYLNTRK
jgi:hypothetical protein